MIASLLVAAVLAQAPGAPLLADHAGHPHFRLVSDDEGGRGDNEGLPSFVTPTVFITAGGAGTLTGIVLLYAGTLTAFAGSASGGMASTVAVGAGVALLAVAIVVIIVAVVFVVIGAVKLSHAFRARQPAARQERFDAQLLPEPPRSPAASAGLVVARF